MGRSQLGMFGPAVLNPVPRLAAMFAFPLAPKSGVRLPTGLTVNLLSLSLLLHGDMADPARLLGTLLCNIVGFLTQNICHNFF